MLALDHFTHIRRLGIGLMVVGVCLVLKTAWSQSMGEITLRNKYESASTVLSTRHESPLAFAMLIAFGYLLGLILLGTGCLAYLG